MSAVVTPARAVFSAPPQDTGASCHSIKFSRLIEGATCILPQGSALNCDSFLETARRAITSVSLTRHFIVSSAEQKPATLLQFKLMQLQSLGYKFFDSLYHTTWAYFAVSQPSFGFDLRPKM